MENIGAYALLINTLFIPAFMWIWRSEGRINKLESKQDSLEKENKELKRQLDTDLKNINDNFKLLFEKFDKLNDEIHNLGKEYVPHQICESKHKNLSCKD